VILAHASRALAVLLSVYLTEASADIYGFMDSSGRAHFSDSRRDVRYKLFKREPAAGFRGGPKLSAVDFFFKTRLPDVTLPTIAPNAEVQVSRAIRAASNLTDLDEALLHAVIAAESRFDLRAKSPRGAVGLMQVTPEMARRYGVRNLYDPMENVRAGALYLRDLMRLFNDNLNLTIAAYNAGHNAVLRFGKRIPPYPETQTFVPRVLAYYRKYQERI